jgi:hypothetical protein
MYVGAVTSTPVSKGEVGMDTRLHGPIVSDEVGRLTVRGSRIPKRPGNGGFGPYFRHPRAELVSQSLTLSFVDGKRLGHKAVAEIRARKGNGSGGAQCN